jgi:hypothetical protein
MLASMPTLSQKPGVGIAWKDYSEDPEWISNNTTSWKNAYRDTLATKASYAWKAHYLQTHTFDESLQITARKPLPLPECFPFVRDPIKNDSIGEKPFHSEPDLTYVEAHALALGALIQVTDAEETKTGTTSNTKSALLSMLNKVLGKEDNEAQDENLKLAKHYSVSFHQQQEGSMLDSTEDMNKSCICGSIYDADKFGEHQSYQASYLDQQWSDIREKFTADTSYGQ